MSAHYDLLGVLPDTSAQDLKSAYRKLAGIYHPDHNPGDALAEAKFKKISEAYAVLKDAAKRNEYDQARNPVRPARPRPSDGFTIKPQYGHHEPPPERAKTMPDSAADHSEYYADILRTKQSSYLDRLIRFCLRHMGVILAILLFTGFLAMCWVNYRCSYHGWICGPPSLKWFWGSLTGR